jgi:hypothetical protein
MTVPRIIALLVYLTVLGIIVVATRAEQARHRRNIEELEFRHTALREQLWGQEMELARLRSPQTIRARFEQFQKESEADSEEDAEAQPEG